MGPHSQCFACECRIDSERLPAHIGSLAFRFACVQKGEMLKPSLIRRWFNDLHGAITDWRTYSYTALSPSS